MSVKEALMTSKARMEKRTVPGVVGDVYVMVAKHAQIKAWMDSEDGDSESIVACIRESNGEPALTFEEVGALPEDIVRALCDTILEVHGLGKEKKD